MKTQRRHDLPPLLCRILCSSLLYVDDLFSVCFLERLCISFSHFLLARYSPFYLCLFLFSFTFVSPYSAYFGVLSNFLARFTRLASRLLLLAFFGRFVSFFPGYFHSKPSLHELELLQFPPVDKALVLLVFLFCELIRNCKTLRIIVQLQSHQFDFALKTWVVYYLLTRPHIN